MSTKFMTGLTLTALAALGLAAAHPAAAQTLISSSFTNNVNGGPYNLTVLGTTDWINFSNGKTPNQKGDALGVVGAISTPTAYGSNGIDTGASGDAPSATWSDGSTIYGGQATGTNKNNDWQVYGSSTRNNSQGYQFTVNLAANTTDLVNVFVGGYNVGNTELKISNGGAVLLDDKNDFSTTSGNPNPNGGYFSTKFVNVGTSPQTLTYDFLQANGPNYYDNVKLGSVTLSSSPIPSAAPEPSQSASLGFTVLAVMGLILKARKRRSQGEAV